MINRKTRALIASGTLTTAALILVLSMTTAQGAPFNTTSDRRVIKTSSPIYPVKARNARVEGDVTVCYTINSQGRVRRTYIESSNNKVFNRAARKAAKGIEYAPAKPGATNDVSPACSTYRFRLNPRSDAAT